MSKFRKALKEYLEVRRSLGFELYAVGVYLHNFVSFLEREGASVITTELALRWAKQPADAQPAQWADRLGIVRRFAQYYSATDPRTEVPPRELLPHRYHRKPPYVYSDKEIKQLITTAKKLSSVTGLRAQTYSTLFGLLVVAGMRISEATSLDRADVDLVHGVLTLRQTKFGKSRLIPIHRTTKKVLWQYARYRDRIYPQAKTSNFFVSERGLPISNYMARRRFIQLSRKIGLRSSTDSHGPRLHDIRHRFAIKTLLRWYRSGIDVERRLPILATYMGHVNITYTYWYLTATPELLQLAAKRLRHTKGGLSS